MKKESLYQKLFIKVLLGLVFFVPARLEAYEFSRTAKYISLGETTVKVNIYEKAGAKITFFAPHFNEMLGADEAKKILSEKGGRLVELESFDQSGNSARFLNFKFQNKFYSLDPNRIYTANGRKCTSFSAEINTKIENFAEDLLKVILPETGRENTLLVALHNNQNVDGKPLNARAGDLTATSFGKAGAFSDQAQGVYLSNEETDDDNFIFLSKPQFLSFFAEQNFNVVVQKPAAQLRTANCQIDDGSLSVFFGQLDFPYINLEADIKTGSARQRQMIEAVYKLAEKLDKKNSFADAGQENKSI